MSLFPQLRSESQVGRWYPFNSTTSILDAFSDMFSNRWAVPVESDWNPAVDIIENDKDILVRMDVPGMDNKNVHVEIDNGSLVIRGERKYEKEHKEENYLCVERRYGQFSRSFRLPEYIDQSHIKAECKNGLLEVRLAKQPGKKKEIKSIAVSN